MNKQAEKNKAAWEYNAYDFWVRQAGTPVERAKEDLENPRAMLKGFAKYFENINGLRIANICGSCGKKAIPLAVLGAEVTIFDLSEENKRYACETAGAAGVSIDYVVGDAMDIDMSVYSGYFDIVFMEGGVLHYFYDINEFMRTMSALLKDGGKMICNDFHPIHKFLDVLSLGASTGDYFSTEIIECEMAHAKFYDEEKRSTFPKCSIRLYTMSEIVNAVLNNGFTIKSLEEHPAWTDKKLPGTYTITADKITE